MSSAKLNNQIREANHLLSKLQKHVSKVYKNPEVRIRKELLMIVDLASVLQGQFETVSKFMRDQELKQVVKK